MLFANEIFFLLPELHWCCSIIALLLISTTLSNKYRTVLITRLGFITLFFIFCFLFLYTQLPVVEYTLFNYQYVSDLFNFTFKVFFLILLAGCLFISFDYYFFERIFFVEYYFLIGFFCISSFLLMSANDLVIFYLAVELQALILYTLAALKRYNVFSAESGLKYFVLGAFSSGLLLFGISLFYGFWGFLNFYDVKFLFLGWFDTKIYFAIVVASVFLLSALLFKLAAAPFHIWTPDVYDGAPSSVVLLFATLPKLAIFAFIVRFYIYFLFEYSFIWYLILFFSGVLSVMIGTIAALNQLNIKRLYAYSAIVNIGYLVTAASYGTPESFSAMFNYLIIYLFSTFTLFLILLLFRNILGLKKIKQLVDYKVFASYSSLLAVFVGLVFFSLAGIPPLAGFFIKFFLFKIIFVSDFLLNPAVFLILVTSVISAFYYVRVVRFIFFETKRATTLFVKLNNMSVFLFVCMSFFIIFFFLFQQFFLLATNYLVVSLYI